jgi:hypothetical protein
MADAAGKNSTEGASPADAKQEAQAARISLRTAVMGVLGVAGLAAYVELVGGAMLWVRYHEAGIPEIHTIADLSPSFLLVIGISALAVPLAVGVAAALLQYVICPETRDSTLPPGFGSVLVIMVAIAFVMAIGVVDELTTVARIGLCVSAVLGALAVRTVVKRATRFVTVALLFFLFGALYGAVFKVVRERSVTPRFDVAVVFREPTKAPTAGLYLGRGTDTVLIARAVEERDNEWQTLAIPEAQVSTLVFGPHGRPATQQTQNRAEVLMRRLINACVDEVRPDANAQSGAAAQTSGDGAVGTTSESPSAPAGGQNIGGDTRTSRDGTCQSSEDLGGEK